MKVEKGTKGLRTTSGARQLSWDGKQVKTKTTAGFDRRGLVLFRSTGWFSRTSLHLSWEARGNSYPLKGDRGKGLLYG